MAKLLPHIGNFKPLTAGEQYASGEGILSAPA